MSFATLWAGLFPMDREVHSPFAPPPVRALIPARTDVAGSTPQKRIADRANR